MGDSLCLPLLCAFSLTMHCSDFLALHAPRLSPPRLNHPPSHRSLNKMHEHTPMLDNPGKKKTVEGFPSVLSLHLFLCHLSVLILPPSLCLYLVSCSLWITSPHPPPASFPSLLPVLQENKDRGGTLPAFLSHVVYIFQPPHLKCPPPRSTLPPYT